MGKQRIVLEHRVYSTTVRRKMRDVAATKQDVAGIGMLETGCESQQRCLAATTGTEKCQEL